MAAYLETSAAAKLLACEDETDALKMYLDTLDDEEVSVVSSFLLETELRRVAVRNNLDQVDVTAILDRIDLVELDRAIYTAAGLLPGGSLRSLDALHVAVALRVEAESMISYDIRQIQAARSAGLAVVTPR